MKTIKNIIDDELDNIIITDELLPFLNGMIKEYNRHKKVKGESWRCYSLRELYELFYKASNITFDDLMEDPSHLFDIANFCWFIWYQKEEIDRGN